MTKKDSPEKDMPRFHIELPPGIALAEATLELWVKSEESIEGITVEILDEGGGAYLKLTTEGVNLDPEELSELNQTLQALCSFIDKNKRKAEK